MKPLFFFALLLFLALLFILFPPGAGGSSAFYISGSFFAAALLFSSASKSMAQGLDSLGLAPKKGALASLLAWGVAALAACIALTLVLSAILQLLGFLDTEPVREKILSLPLLSLIAAFTLSPLGEESFFRGLLFRKISEKTASPLFGAFSSSVLFAAFHLPYGSVAEVAVAFFLSLALCYFTRRTGSLVPALFAHASFNLLSITMALVFA